MIDLDHDTGIRSSITLRKLVREIGNKREFVLYLQAVYVSID